ncbi:hypothetical protein AB1L88_15715 [Tautonia sp. JC769]|uniref:hypothetical protein n=1 Tax=Tautonia sp. JC769 TaxID=3232135 RepID=UPI003457ADA0
MSQTAPKPKDPYDCLVIPQALLGSVAAEARRKSGRDPASEPMAHLHGTMMRHVHRRYGHLLGLGPDDLGRLRARKIHAGPYAQHDLFVVDDFDATINFPKDHPFAGRCRYAMTPLADGALVGRLVDEAAIGLPDLPDPVPVEDPAVDARRKDLIRARDGKDTPEAVTPKARNDS